MSSTPWSSRENPSPADQLHHFSYLRTASDRSIVGLTATQLRDELSVYSKAEVDSLLEARLIPTISMPSAFTRVPLATPLTNILSRAQRGSNSSKSQQLR